MDQLGRSRVEGCLPQLMGADLLTFKCTNIQAVPLREHGPSLRAPGGVRSRAVSLALT